MSKFIAGALLFLLMTAVLWTAVLWQWESTRHNMSVSDIVIYLGLLPLACFGLLLALRWAWRGAGERQAAAAAARASVAPAGTVAERDGAGEEARRHATTLLLGAWLRSAAGDAPADLMDAAKAGEPRPSLDAELRDDNGMPLMAARIADLDTAELDAAAVPLVAATAAQQPQRQSMQPATHVLRALTALQPPLTEAVLALQSWSERFAPADPQAPIPAGAARPPQRLVRMLVALPETWHAFECGFAQLWIEQLVQEYSTEIPAQRFRVETHTASGPELWLKADQLLQSLARESRDDAVLLAACHSDLSGEAVAALEHARRLFSASACPKGVMPGEAAVTLLLALPGWPSAPQDERSPIHLHRPAVSRRDKSIEAAGKVSSEFLQHACTQALAASRLEADSVKALVCDADQHSQRSTELFGTTLALLPDLDPTEDMRVLGTVTGHTGAAGTLAVVAAAAAQARSLEAPCAALSLGDPYFRLALVARPDAPGAAAVSSPAA